MRAFAVLIALLLAGVVLWCGYAAATAVRRGRRERDLRDARWQVRHYGVDGRTVVAVVLVTPAGAALDEHVVARLPEADPDWQTRFLGARQEAEERAFHLNSGLA